MQIWISSKIRLTFLELVDVPFYIRIDYNWILIELKISTILTKLKVS
jgi:hypothetical protein